MERLLSSLVRAGLWIRRDPGLVKRYYEVANIPGNLPWKLSRKHIRIVTRDGRFIKLNTIRNRINPKALWRLCAKYAPAHVYMSVLDYLFPERVGLKSKAKNAYPIGGEYVVDVDNYLFRGIDNHEHPRTWICNTCLEIARRYSIRLSEIIEENYSNIMIVFSGARGFHIHVLDFKVGDWTFYNEHDPVKSHEVARFRYTLHLSRQLDTRFDEPHFTLSVDPMRVISVPYTLNASTMLVCRPIGSRLDLERKSVTRILDEANPSLEIWPVKVTPEHECDEHER
jgi:hypothetical protein